MAKAQKSASRRAPAKAPAFPKTLVRVRKEGAGWTVDERIVADAREESAATKEGFHLPDPAAEPEPIPYPSWRYHPTEGKRIVESEEADKALGAGWQDSPPTPEEQMKAATRKG